MNPLNPDRYYELTELHPNDAYSRSNIGSIIRPRPTMHDHISCPGFRVGSFEIVHGHGAFVSLKGGFFAGARLRPLTQKEQEKIDEGLRSPAAG